MKTLNKHSFSLIELLVVMILMGIMVGISLPALSNGSKQVALACTDVCGQLAIARSYAIANNCYTAVIFPQQSEIEDLMPSADSLKAQALAMAAHFNASCRVAIVAKHPTLSDSFYFVMWIPDSNWVTFSGGALIATESSKDFGIPVCNVPFGSLYKIANRKTGAITDDVTSGLGPTKKTIHTRKTIKRCIVFTRNGQVESSDSSTSPLIYVRSGTYDLATKSLVPKEDTVKRFSVISISPLSGQTKVSSVNDDATN